MRVWSTETNTYADSTRPPNIHNYDPSVRPRWINTIVKSLTHKLKPIRKEQSSYRLDDICQFAEQIKQLNTTKKCIISLEVPSIFTKSHFRNHLLHLWSYREQWPPTYSNTSSCSVLAMWNSNSPWVAMRSPLGRILADISMGKLEKLKLKLDVHFLPKKWGKREWARRFYSDKILTNENAFIEKDGEMELWRKSGKLTNVLLSTRRNVASQQLVCSRAKNIYKTCLSGILSYYLHREKTWFVLHIVPLSLFYYQLMDPQ